MAVLRLPGPGRLRFGRGHADQLRLLAAVGGHAGADDPGRGLGSQPHDAWRADLAAASLEGCEAGRGDTAAIDQLAAPRACIALPHPNPKPATRERGYPRGTSSRVPRLRFGFVSPAATARCEMRPDVGCPGVPRPAVRCARRSLPADPSSPCWHACCQRRERVAKSEKSSPSAQPATEVYLSRRGVRQRRQSRGTPLAPPTPHDHRWLIVRIGAKSGPSRLRGPTVETSPTSTSRNSGRGNMRRVWLGLALAAGHGTALPAAGRRGGRPGRRPANRRDAAALNSCLRTWSVACFRESPLYFTRSLISEAT